MEIWVNVCMVFFCIMLTMNVIVPRTDLYEGLKVKYEFPEGYKRGLYYTDFNLSMEELYG